VKIRHLLCEDKKKYLLREDESKKEYLLREDERKKEYLLHAKIKRTKLPMIYRYASRDAR
jgi:hypothetical protein